MYKVLLISFLNLVVASVIGFATVPNAYLAPDRPPKLEVSILSELQADMLFREFKNDVNIPFRYPIDGCYARATAMTKIAEKRGLTMVRVNAEGNLQIKTESKKFPLIQWGWHVAPMAYVKKANGTLEKMVFDPSLFDKPVPEEVWLQKMRLDTEEYKTQITEVYYGNRNQYLKKKNFKPPHEGRELYRDRPYQDEELGELSVNNVFKRYHALQDFVQTPSTSTPNVQNSQEAQK